MASNDPTVTLREPSPSPGDAMFSPGTLLGRRFRIIARIGRGGMGEVYRADDLKLGTEVALKFLPRNVSFDEKWLGRFRAEVRVARELSHPNLCRVYDLDDVEVEGGTLHFISMEYIDGEDLGSLLRRIGRLPKDKATQVARQLCAGLAAAHAAGVLHRDLKPANVMLDGRGTAKIADFGIAGFVGQIVGGDIRSGTPEYMAPEQISGQEVSPRSDLYSLGLVLHELFTGHKAGESVIPGVPPTEPGTRTASQLTRPSSFVDDLDPAVERVMLQCLADDPLDRPSSARAVAAALPGGDPLQAALEAGETPSPELVAAAGPRGTISYARAAMIAVPGVLSILLVLALCDRTELVNFIPLPRPPAVLADKAVEMLHALGYTEEPRGVAQAFTLDYSYVEEIERNNKGVDRFAALRDGRPSVMRFWRRTSPGVMAPMRASGRILPTDPARDVPGMTTLEVDTIGRLHSFIAVPPCVAPSTASGPGEGDHVGPVGVPVVDWSALFKMADLDPSQFKTVEPDFVPPHFANSRSAWQGAFPGHADLPLRVEAASVGGRPTYFALVGPWALRERETGPERQSTRQRIGLAASISLVISALVASIAIARRNVRLGRGDRRGATRLAGGLLALHVASWVLSADHHTMPNIEWPAFVLHTGVSLFLAAMAWLLYVALEPFIRRKNPRLIVSWSRLLAGKWKDPIVGRDVLVGLATGAVFVALMRATPVVESLFGHAPPAPYGRSAPMLSSDRIALGTVLVSALLESLLVFFLFVWLAALLRKGWLAGVAFLALCMLAFGAQSGSNSLAVIYAMQAVGLLVLILVITRYGLLTLLALSFTLDLFNLIPVTRQLDQWYAHSAIIGLGTLALLGGWAFMTATQQGRVHAGTIFRGGGTAHA